MTLGFDDLPDDSFTLTLHSGSSRFRDVAGNVLDGERHLTTTVPSGDGTAGGDFVVGFSIESGPPQHEAGSGGRIRCDAVYVRIAGFKPKLMGERARRPFTLFYEERGDGLFHVVRAVGKTSFGLAVLLLRE